MIRIQPLTQHPIYSAPSKPDVYRITTHRSSLEEADLLTFSGQSTLKPLEKEWFGATQAFLTLAQPKDWMEPTLQNIFKKLPQNKKIPDLLAILQKKIQSGEALEKVSVDLTTQEELLFKAWCSKYFHHTYLGTDNGQPTMTYTKWAVLSSLYFADIWADYFDGSAQKMLKEQYSLPIQAKYRKLSGNERDRLKQLQQEFRQSIKSYSGMHLQYSLDDHIIPGDLEALETAYQRTTILLAKIINRAKVVQDVPEGFVGDFFNALIQNITTGFQVVQKQLTHSEDNPKHPKTYNIHQPDTTVIDAETMGPVVNISYSQLKDQTRKGWWYQKQEDDLEVFFPTPEGFKQLRNENWLKVNGQQFSEFYIEVKHDKNSPPKPIFKKAHNYPELMTPSWKYDFIVADCLQFKPADVVPNTLIHHITADVEVQKQQKLPGGRILDLGAGTGLARLSVMNRFKDQSFGTMDNPNLTGKLQWFPRLYGVDPVGEGTNILLAQINPYNSETISGWYEEFFPSVNQLSEQVSKNYSARYVALMVSGAMSARGHVNPKDFLQAVHWLRFREPGEGYITFDMRQSVYDDPNHPHSKMLSLLQEKNVLKLLEKKEEQHRRLMDGTPLMDYVFTFRKTSEVPPTLWKDAEKLAEEYKKQ